MFVLSVSECILIVIQFALSQKIKILFRFYIKIPILACRNDVLNISINFKTISNAMRHIICDFITIIYF